MVTAPTAADHGTAELDRNHAPRPTYQNRLEIARMPAQRDNLWAESFEHGFWRFSPMRARVTPLE
jgi:hypothetical protein